MFCRFFIFYLLEIDTSLELVRQDIFFNFINTTFSSSFHQLDKQRPTNWTQTRSGSQAPWGLARRRGTLDRLDQRPRSRRIIILLVHNGRQLGQVQRLQDWFVLGLGLTVVLELVLELGLELEIALGILRVLFAQRGH